MKKTALTRSIPYWLLIVVSLASAGVGGWIVSDTTARLTAALDDGTATGTDVYVGQPWILVGAIALGAGVIGILLALALGAAASLVRSAGRAIGTSSDEASVEASSDEAVDTDDELREDVALDAPAPPVSEEAVSSAR